MRILLISYSIIEYDGRLRELHKVAQNIGETYYVTKSISRDSTEKYHCIFIDSGLFSYVKFIKFCVKVAGIINNEKKIDVIFADNRKAILPAIIIKNIFNIQFLILDLRELYILKEMKNITGVIGCLLEKLFNNKFNVIICANKQRAEIMYKYYKLKTKPLIFENIRKLSPLIEGKEKQTIRLKYDKIFNKNTFKVIATDGCSKERETDKLIHAIGSLGKNYNLIIVGKTDDSLKEYFDQLISKNNYENIIILGMVNEKELQYLVGNSNVGYVGYPQDTFNNKYCASGKLYEFLYEALPVITTTNPPLFYLCNRYNVGVSSDDYIYSTLKIFNNYEYYKKKVIEYVKKCNIDINDKTLVEQIRRNME